MAQVKIDDGLLRRLKRLAPAYLKRHTNRVSWALDRWMECQEGVLGGAANAESGRGPDRAPAARAAGSDRAA